MYRLIAEKFTIKCIRNSNKSDFCALNFYDNESRNKTTEECHTNCLYGALCKRCIIFSY